MLGILLAFRRLATSSELEVLRGLGMSFGRLMRVPFAFAFALALLNLAIVGFIQHYARYAYEGRSEDNTTELHSLMHNSYAVYRSQQKQTYRQNHNTYITQTHN